MAWRRLALVVAVLAVATLLPLTAGEAGATEEGAFDPQLGIPVKEISRIRDANVAFLFANRDRYGPGRHAPKRKLLPIFRELRPDAMTFFSLGAPSFPKPQEGDEIDEVLKLWPGFAGAIHTFEPAPRWIPHLEQKYRTQIAAGTVVLVPKAVSERDGTATMCDSGSCSRWTAGQLQVDRANGVLTERTGAIRMDTAVRLDSYVAQAVPGALPADPTGDPRAPELDMVMMDIEGYEAPALRGMRELLSRRRIAVLFFEYGPQWSDYVGDLFLGERAEAASVAEMPPERLRDAVAYLHALGYACFFMGDDLLVTLSGRMWHDDYEMNRRPRSADDSWLLGYRAMQDVMCGRRGDPLLRAIVEKWHSDATAREQALVSYLLV